MSLPVHRHHNPNNPVLSSSYQALHPYMRRNNLSPVVSPTTLVKTTITAYLSVSVVSAHAVLTDTLRAHNAKVWETRSYSNSPEREDCASDMTSPSSITSSRSPASSISSTTSAGSEQDKPQTAKQQPQRSLPDKFLFPSSGSRSNSSAKNPDCKICCDEGSPTIRYCHRDSLSHLQTNTHVSPTPLLFNVGFDPDPYLDESSQVTRQSPRISSIKRHERASSSRARTRSTRPPPIRTTCKSSSLARLPRQQANHAPLERSSDINGDYDARLLTQSALRNAQRRSETIKMAARMRAAELKRNSSASGLPDFSTGPFSREYVRDRGQPSPLRTSWVPNESQARARTYSGSGLATLAPSSHIDSDAAFLELLSKPIDLAAYWSKGR